MPIKIKGLKELLTKLERLPNEVHKKVDAVFSANANEIEARAKAASPIDLGTLRQSISAQKINDKDYKVYANYTGLAPYAAYMEFGTGGRVSVPSELQDQAIKFKGAGKRKVDIRPRPYMYPSLQAQRPILLKDLENLLDNETKRV